MADGMVLTRPRGASVPNRDEIAGTWARIKRAILTLSVLPDREALFIYGSQRAMWPEPVREIRDAYGYEVARRPKFRPTARDVDDVLPVFAELTWLKNHAEQVQGERDSREFRILWARAFDTPWWKLEERYRRGERTLRRWHDGAVMKIHCRLVP